MAYAHLIRAKLLMLWVLLLLNDFLQAHCNSYPASCRSSSCERMGGMRGCSVQALRNCRTYVRTTEKACARKHKVGKRPYH